MSSCPAINCPRSLTLNIIHVYAYYTSFLIDGQGQLLELLKFLADLRKAFIQNHRRYFIFFYFFPYISQKLLKVAKKRMSRSHVILKHVGFLLLCAVIYNCLSLLSFVDFLISFDIYLYSLVTFSGLSKRIGRFYLDVISKIKLISMYCMVIIVPNSTFLFTPSVV